MYAPSEKDVDIRFVINKYYEIATQLYLSVWSSNPRNKTILYPETFKVERNKVPFMTKDTQTE